MSAMAKMSVALSREMAETVRQAVESGEYASDSEVIREALREWKLRRQLRQREREELQRMWAEGLAAVPNSWAVCGPSNRRRAGAWRLLPHLSGNEDCLPRHTRTARAEEDLVEIWLYIAQDNPPSRRSPT